MAFGVQHKQRFAIGALLKTLLTDVKKSGSERTSGFGLFSFGVPFLVPCRLFCLVGQPSPKDINGIPKPSNP